VTYRGQTVHDEVDLLDLPAPLASVLRDVNGFVAFRGGLHIRGVVKAPKWHSLADRWQGENALCQHYRSITKVDVPFGENALGDQFFLRSGAAWRLFAETDEVERISDSLDVFFDLCLGDSIEFLGLHAMLQL
jgi:hypothetical protein